jgi:hypothetical protein
LDCGEKSFFPYLLNTSELLSENDGKLEKFPQLKYFLPNSLTSDTYEELLVWWVREKERHEREKIPYDLKTNLITYCCQDVLLSVRAANKYRELFLKIGGFDCFAESHTLSSAGHLMFRSNFYSLEKPILTVSPHGVDRQTKNSRQAKMWLRWFEFDQGHQMQYEYRVGRFYADAYFCVKHPLKGFPEIPVGASVLLEFQGCRFHGCPECFLPGETEALSGKKMHQLKRETEMKISSLEKMGFWVIQKFSHEFEAELKGDQTMKQFINQNFGHCCSGDIRPEEGMFGGR